MLLRLLYFHLIATASDGGLYFCVVSVSRASRDGSAVAVCQVLWCVLSYYP